MISKIDVPTFIFRGGFCVSFFVLHEINNLGYEELKE